MAKKKRPTPAGQPGARRSSQERRAAAQEAIQERRRAERRRSLLIQGGIALVVIVVVVAVTIAVLQKKKADDAPAARPAGMTKDLAIRFGPADAKVTVRAVEDFQCPTCRQFESTEGSLLAKYRESGSVALEYRPIAFLDRSSSTDYSSRAYSASMCVLDAAGKKTWLAYHQSLYENQPEEGTAGLTDAKLAQLAKQAGATQQGVASCIKDEKYRPLAKQATSSAFDDGVEGTPTIFVNGKKLGGFDAATITKAVQAAS